MISSNVVRRFDVRAFVLRQFNTGLRDAKVELTEMQLSDLQGMFNIDAVQRSIDNDLRRTRSGDWSQRAKMHERQLRRVCRKVAAVAAAGINQGSWPVAFRARMVNRFFTTISINWKDGNESPVIISDFRCEIYPFCNEPVEEDEVTAS